MIAAAFAMAGGDLCGRGDSVGDFLAKTKTTLSRNAPREQRSWGALSRDMSRSACTLAILGPPAPTAAQC
jgi:hypothetical protein